MPVSGNSAAAAGSAWENPLRVIIENVIVSQGLILPMLQIINRSIYQLEMMFGKYIYGDLIIFNYNSLIIR